LVSEPVLWHLGDVLEMEWLSRRLVRRLEMLRHHSRRSLCHRTHTVVLFRRRHLHLSFSLPSFWASLIQMQCGRVYGGLRPELRQALMVVHVIDLDAAYQTAAALEADTLRTRSRSTEVQTQFVERLWYAWRCLIGRETRRFGVMRAETSRGSGGSSSTPVPGESSHSGVGAP
ncbi:hypothetical protein Taro_048030, partial [Colocasia esculenta]|nr:hypothetical protein [Colocasia esculenta]